MSKTSLAVPVSLDHHKQQAKQLLKDVQSGDQQALDRVGSVRPKLTGKDPFLLADAQSVIAKEQGVDSWRQLKDQSGGGAKGKRLNDVHGSLAQAIAEIHSEYQNTAVTCRVTGTREVPFSEYLAELTPDQVSYTFLLEPLGDKAILEFSGSVAWAHVYRDGGLEGEPPTEPRHPTAEDREQLTPMVIRHLQSLEKAWGPELKLWVINAEVQWAAEDLRITTDDDPVTITTVSVKAPTFDGTIRMIYPTRIISPALDPNEWANLAERRPAEILATRQTIDVKVPAGISQESGMCYVPAGHFKMGDHQGHYNDVTPREVNLSAFWIDTYPVTNAEYEVFVKETGHSVPPHWTSGSYQRDQANHPVTNINWDEAGEYAAWLGKRLPTEAEREKASRGTEGQVYPWGDTYWKVFCNGCNDYGGTTPVDQFPEASPYGTFDMCGNVFEWCSDWYEEGYVSSGLTNPTGPETGEYRSIRGGFYRGSRSDLRCAYRGWAPQQNKQDHIGFRCVKDVD